jgi:hypothetical protein
VFRLFKKVWNAATSRDRDRARHVYAGRILAVAVGEGFPLPAALLKTLTTWLDRHVGMERACRLKALLDRVRPGICEAAVPGTIERGEGGAIATTPAPMPGAKDRSAPSRWSTDVYVRRGTATK